MVTSLSRRGYRPAAIIGGMPPAPGPGNSELPVPALFRKLGLRPGQRLVLLSAPPGWPAPGLPPLVDVAYRRVPVPDGAADVAIFFARAEDQLVGRAGHLSKTITVDGSLWVAWPRRAGGHTSDLTDNLVRRALLPLGLVDVKVAALDQDWSGLKFVWRRELRPALRAGTR